jgi:threonine dehydratase
VVQEALWKQVKLYVSIAQVVIRLVAGKSTAVLTTKTIMKGMNCGTLSSAVFEDLQRGIDASATISGFKAHLAILYLAGKSVNSGPYGGAALAALWRLADSPNRSA